MARKKKAKQNDEAMTQVAESFVAKEIKNEKVATPQTVEKVEETTTTEKPKAKVIREGYEYKV